jgi:hypothetical protein
MGRMTISVKSIASVVIKESLPDEANSLVIGHCLCRNESTAQCGKRLSQPCSQDNIAKLQQRFKGDFRGQSDADRGKASIHSKSL